MPLLCVVRGEWFGRRGRRHNLAALLDVEESEDASRRRCRHLDSFYAFSIVCHDDSYLANLIVAVVLWPCWGHWPKWPAAEEYTLLWPCTMPNSKSGFVVCTPCWPRSHTTFVARTTKRCFGASRVQGMELEIYRPPAAFHIIVLNSVAFWYAIQPCWLVAWGLKLRSYIIEVQTGINKSSLVAALHSFHNSRTCSYLGFFKLDSYIS